MVARAADLHFKQGLSLQQKGQTRLAIREYEAALSVDPDHMASETNLGILLLVQGETVRAIEHFQKIVNRDPKTADNHFNLAKALMLNKDPRTALEHFRQAEALDPKDAQVLKNMFECHSLLGEYDQGILKLKELAAITPSDGSVFMSLARENLKVGRVPEAREAFERARQLLPEDPEPVIGLAEILQKGGCPEDSFRLFREGASLSPGRAECYLGAASALRDMGRNEEAVEELSLLLSYHPGNEAARAMLRELDNGPNADNYQGERKEAESDLRLERFRSPDFIERRASRLFELKDWNRAVSEFSKIIEAAPTRLSRRKFAIALSRAGRKEEAWAQFQGLLEEEPRDLDVAAEFVNALLAAGDLEEARRITGVLEGQFPDDSRVRFLRGKYLLKAGNLEEAKKRFEWIIRDSPGCVEACLALSDIAYQSDQLEDAIRLWQIALRYSPDRNELLFLTAACQHRLRRFGQACRTMKRYLETNRSDVSGRGFLAEIFLKLKRTHDAKSTWKEMAGSSPSTPEDAVARAKANLFLGNMEAAREQFRLVLKAHGGIASAHFYIGILEMTRNEIQKAAESWKTAWDTNRFQVESELRFIVEYFNPEKLFLVKDELGRVEGCGELIAFMNEILP